MKKLLLALAVLATAGQITPLFRHYDDDRPGLLERAVTAPARVVDPEYREEFRERKYSGNKRYRSDSRYTPENKRMRRSRRTVENDEMPYTSERMRTSRTADLDLDETI